MATKRKFDSDEKDEVQTSNKKHTLDSDEEDSDDYEKQDLNDSDIEGEEEGEAKIQDEVKFTPFNMREELEEGHFDKDGHYHWNKEAEVKDNWLDNIDWVKVKSDKNYLNADSDDDSQPPESYNEARAYARLLDYMEQNETVKQALQRLGKNRSKMSTAERLRRKRLGIVDEAAEKITNFTALTNEILTKTGNMDIYEQSFADIKNKVNSVPSTSKGAQSASVSVNDSCDMYSDDFEDKEKTRLKTKGRDNDTQPSASSSKNTELQWEFKWKQEDSKLEGPYSTQQMLKWSQQKYFKDGVYVRKVGELTNFYSSNRIDFDLYL